jgi:predicted O-linked N-acetylglucosamine transferase (SPINDLY family)
VSERLQGLATHWRRIEGLGDAQLAELIRADGIDVLIDLAGHTADNRLAALALRPAPVQVSFLGYPNTTGSPAIGYYITDAYLDPPGEADARYTERLVRLPLFCCYRPPAAPDPAPPPVTGNGYVTFGSFSSLAKLNERVVALWARVLRALPTARLLLQSAALADEQTGTAWRARFAAHDVSGDRLELAGHLPLDDYLRAHGRVDIALDPFPWSGHTTTCHALWMGVPAVTLAASTHAARMTADILRVIGLEELVAATEDEYVALAVALASDRTRLAQLRRDLRRRMSHSPLCDAAGFTRELEQAYRRLWRAWCATAR